MKATPKTINNSILALVKAFHESGAFHGLNHPPLTNLFFFQMLQYIKVLLMASNVIPLMHGIFAEQFHQSSRGTCDIFEALPIIHHSGESEILLSAKVECRQTATASYFS